MTRYRIVKKETLFFACIVQADNERQAVELACESDAWKDVTDERDYWEGESELVTVEVDG
jgi:hypothetical protein